MAGYPGSETERRFSRTDLQGFVSATFERAGMRTADASLVADTLVVADLRGCHSHGVLRVPDYVEKFRSGGVDPVGQPLVASDRIGALVVDGCNSMGQIGSALAMTKAVERAEQTGVAAAAVRGSNHCGAMAYFAMMALEQNMIGLATTNALPTMAPWGGTDKIVGINPLAIAIPAGEEDPIVIDAAFSASSHGKIRIYEQKGLELPEGWAFDAEGSPTTSATAALDGLLRPIGDYKGVGLSVVMGVLSTALSGASYGTESGNMIDGAYAGRDGQFMLAINVEAFVDSTEFGRRVDTVIRQIRASGLASGCDRVYSPGELEASTERRYAVDGIPLNEETLTGLAACAESLHLDRTLEPLPNSR